MEVLFMEITEVKVGAEEMSALVDIALSEIDSDENNAPVKNDDTVSFITGHILNGAAIE